MHKAIEQLNNTLEELKDFQRATVEATMLKYKDKNHSNRVLVADEVGLGKTIVAKGIIAQLLKDRMASHDVNKPLIVTYICSNLTLANENKKKLAVFKGDMQHKHVAEPSFGRLLELSVKEKEFEYSKNTLLEVNALTPSTSFKLTSGNGNMWERYIIFRLLIQDKELYDVKSNLSKLFQTKYLLSASWERQERKFAEYEIDNKIKEDFLQLIKKPIDNNKCLRLDCDSGSLKSILLNNCRGNDLNTDIIYYLRTLIRIALAQCCAKNLDADLFILDEFQRFQSLLDTNEENEESLIAREVLAKKGNTKILLLSATPFKALTRLNEEKAEGAHLDELKKLLSFLSNDKDFVKEYEKEREALLNQILRLSHDHIVDENLSPVHKNAVQKLLSSYICRTERAQVSKDFDQVFEEIEIDSDSTFSFDEIQSFKAMDQLGKALNSVSKTRSGSYLLEFYKAAPWALSFLSGYQLIKQLKNHNGDGIKKALEKSSKGWLSRKKIERYRLDIAKDAPNAKLKALIDVFFGDVGEKLLWIPPTLPYYKSSGSYAKADKFSKSLLFSSWAIVPKALSGLISYEAERRNYRYPMKHKYFHKDKHKGKLKFITLKEIDTWCLTYPAQVLVNMKFENTSLSVDEIIESRSKFLKEKYSFPSKYLTNDLTREQWYAFAPILLDIIEGKQSYVSQWLEIEGSNTVDKKKMKVLSYIDKLIDENKNISYIPAYLCQHLAELSVASPAICIARMQETYWSKEKFNFTLNSNMVAATIFMFNRFENEAILKTLYDRKKEPYWKKVLKYCIDGNFQSMIDEYAHLLVDSGLSQSDMSERFCEVLKINQPGGGCLFTENVNKNLDEDDSRLRYHYAVPIGTQKLSDEKGVERVGNVRDAFNSPFRPFVLNSTSIGQEGLDFHWYCSRVIHWNLPSNPIDIEQREGRVNRYKSLVVRRRVEEIYASLLEKLDGNIWSELFKIADEETKKERVSDLVPYWHLEEGQAQIERIIPMMPMSREVERKYEMIKILALYRLAFGQPRQEELLNILLNSKMKDSEIKAMMDALVINLAPLMHKIKGV